MQKKMNGQGLLRYGMKMEIGYNIEFLCKIQTPLKARKKYIDATQYNADTIRYSYSTDVQQTSFLYNLFLCVVCFFCHFYIVCNRFEQERLENDTTELDSEVMAQMDDDFTQERKPAVQQETSADYTNINTQDLMANDSANRADTTTAPPPTVIRNFQFSGFKDEV